MFNNKKGISLITLVLIVVAVIAISAVIIVLVMNNYNDNSTNINKDTDSQLNNSDNTANSNLSVNTISYYDKSRNINDTYTFKEATDKFAFLVGDSTLIFKSKEKVKLEMIYKNQDMDTQFEYDNEIHTSLNSMYIGKSNSTTLQNFITNFNNGILSDTVSKNVENVKILESANDYVFASWINKGFSTTYEYYYAQKIGDNIYYVYNSSIVSQDNKTSILLSEFKELFTCLSIDDGKEAYIYDKIMNVPIVLNKQIKDVNCIYAITNSNNDYLDGSVSFSSDNGDYINLEYGARGHYNKIDWAKNFDASIKYLQDDNKNVFGVISDNLTQVFEITIYSNEKITNTKEFNNYISKFLTDK